MSAATLDDNDTTKRWHVLRDLKRPNAKENAYSMLSNLGIEVFTPMREVVVNRRGRRQRELKPIVSDLLFAREAREALDRVVRRTPTLQFRYLRGGRQFEAMTVDDCEMDSFIAFTRRAAAGTRYYAPDEVNPEMVGREIRIAGGPMDGLTGRIFSVKGSKKKRLMVTLPGIIAAAVVIEDDFIEILP